LYTLVDEVVLVLDALIRISSQTEGEFGSPAAGDDQRSDRKATIQVRNLTAWLGCLRFIISTSLMPE
jgi:hypothetical protein